MNRLVISVSGASGAGKTTLVRETVRRLGEGAAVLFFDAYAATSHYPPDMGQWLRRGADPAAWRTPRLAKDLRALKEGIPVVLPDEKTRVAPAPFILLEEPFGRARPEMASLIDLAVFIDLPLEIALARRLLRTLSAKRFQEAPEAAADHLRDYLNRYLNEGVRELYLAAAGIARRSSDVVLDGKLSADALADTLVEMMRQAREEAGSGGR